MSITISTDVFCDRCDNWTEGVSCATHGRTKAARKAARKKGWLCSSIEGDFCPDCKNAVIDARQTR